MTSAAQLRPVGPLPKDLEGEIHRARLEAYRALARAEELELELANVKPTIAAADDKQLLTYEEAASDLGMSPDFVRGLCRNGRLPVVKLGTRRRIRRSDLEELKERRVFRRQ